MFNIIDNSQIIKKISNDLYLEINKKYSITQNELMIICYLHHSDESNNTAKDIVDNLMFSKSHVSASIDSLSKKNMIIKKNDEKDKKRIHLELTNSCDEIIKAAENKKIEILKIMLNDFSDEEKELLRKYTMKIHNNIKNYMN